jgi:ribose-phosphate pyrophosphokinase
MGEPFSLKAFAKIINSLGYRSVECWDAHSYVTEAVIENCTSFPSHEVITPITGPTGLEPYLQNWRPNLVIVAPDAGGEKRAAGFAKHFQFERLLTLAKTRDPRNGEITGVSLPRSSCHIPEFPRFLIVDDICDGGRTFVEVAKVIKGSYSNVQGIDLFVTHGIFSKGVNALAPWIDTIFTTNSLLLEPTLPLDTLIERNVKCA